MKRLFIAIFAMLAVVGMQAQVVSTKEHYSIGNIGLMQVVEIKVAVEKYNDDVYKFCIFEHTTSKGNTIGLKITADELEVLLRKMDEIKVGNMNLNCDYFEKEYTISKDITHELSVGFYIKTKLDANKGQQWYFKINDGIHEVFIFPTFNDIYKVLGKARAKLQTL
jgi:hypothetical protein